MWPFKRKNHRQLMLDAITKVHILFNNYSKILTSLTQNNSRKVTKVGDINLAGFNLPVNEQLEILMDNLVKYYKKMENVLKKDSRLYNPRKIEDNIKKINRILSKFKNFETILKFETADYIELRDSISEIEINIRVLPED